MLLKGQIQMRIEFSDPSSLVNISLICAIILLFLYLLKSVYHFVSYMLSLLDYVLVVNQVYVFIYFSTRYLVDLSLETLIDTCLLHTAILHNV